MKTKKLRLVSALLALAMLLALLPTAAFAEDNKCGDNLTWKLENGTLTISGEGAMYNYERQSSQSAPWRDKNIINVVIEDGVTTIGKYAFLGCGNLKTVSLPESGSLKTIEYSAFGNRNSSSSTPIITEIKIPASVKTIGAFAFMGCERLGTVTFASNSQLDSINGQAFDGTVLTEITIPASITGLDGGAFENCKSLTKVTFETPSKLNYVGNGIFSDCSAGLKIYGDDNVRNILKTAGVDVGKIETYPSETDDTPKTDPDTNPDTKTETYPITIDYGTAYDADGNKIEKAAKGDVVTIEADETAFDGMTFEYWKDHNGNVTLVSDHAAKTSFAMPEGEVHLEAVPKAAENDDTSWDAATVVTGVAVGAGTAILAYHIGTELYAEQVLDKGVPVPKTRADVALLAWKLAGEPAVELNGEPLSEAAQAEKWAVESGLMHSDADGSFNGAKKMSKLKALRTLNAAKKLG